MRRTLASLLLLGGLLRAQAPPEGSPAASENIQDNSFLIEEAYNQDAGAVQHISNFTYNPRTADWLYSFTQEWPVPTIKHQLSYTIPYQRFDDGGGPQHGAGDVLLNYRYQLLGDGDAKIAVAPRLSLLLPTGDWKRGLGSGGWGVQTNWPLSVVLGKHFVAHSNLGATLVSAAKNSAGDEADTISYNAGQSLIWLPARRFNLMLEAAWSRSQFVTGPDRTDRADAFFISPGVRWSYNFSNGLQIVPGFAVPVGVGPSRGTHFCFFYLSFEHLFKR